MRLQRHRRQAIAIRTVGVRQSFCLDLLAAVPEKVHLRRSIVVDSHDFALRSLRGLLLLHQISCLGEAHPFGLATQLAIQNCIASRDVALKLPMKVGIANDVLISNDVERGERRGVLDTLVVRVAVIVLLFTHAIVVQGVLEVRVEETGRGVLRRS